ncbi:MAG: type II secretion system F family protein [Alphaproteobacteria bacterium]|uniref:Type II secretion system F family protein n=1 Tax=Candidatus Nitrobium versatile TaxID=2884831 RepID=A0A953M3K8_9BACT|nr:type II secretion system F family protein [Candidatus Nitrobium versatile]
MATIFTAKYILNGKGIQKDFFLPDEGSVRSAIWQQGGITLSIRERDVVQYRRPWVRIDKEEKIRFLHAVSLHAETFAPAKALMMTIESEQDTGKRIEYERALEVINGGGYFSEAIMQLGMFDKAVVAILKEGEETGTLKKAIVDAIDYLESRKRVWKEFRAAAGWLGIDVISALLSVVGMQFGFLPWLEKSGAMGQGGAKAGQLKEAIRLAYVCNEVLLAIAFFVMSVALFLAVGTYLKKGAIRDHVERAFIRFPFLRSVILDGTFADTFFILGRMLKGGVDLLSALQAASEATSIPAVIQYWRTVRGRIFDGTTTHRAFESKLITDAERKVLSAHQNNTQLGDLLLSMAETRGYSYQRGLRRLVRAAGVSTVLFITASMGSALYVSYIQNQGITEQMRYLGEGGM